MAHVVILGAGIGGIPAAYEMKEKLGNQHSVTVINATDIFQFVPSNPWVGVGWRKRPETTVKIGPYLKKKNIDFIAKKAIKIEPKSNTLTLEDDQIISYDYLIITTGPDLAFDAIPGLGPDGFTQSVCTIDHAEHAHAAYQKFTEKPGPIIIGAAQGASCFGPAYEYAFILDTDLCKKKIRHDVPMTYITSEPYIGHLGLGGVGDSKSMMEQEFRNRHIKWICNAKIHEVKDSLMIVHECDEQGETIKVHELPFDYSMIIPPFRGVAPVAAVEEMCNPKGFVKVNDYQQNPEYANIYSAGVCIAIPPVEVTPVPTGTPKTGYMIESMVTAIVENIAADIEGKPLHAIPTWSALCLADMGDTGGAFLASPQIPPRNITWFKKGKWVHVAKVAFEKFFIRKVKTGKMESWGENRLLKMMGLEKIKK